MEVFMGNEEMAVAIEKLMEHTRIHCRQIGELDDKITTLEDLVGVLVTHQPQEVQEEVSAVLNGALNRIEARAQLQEVANKIMEFMSPTRHG